MNENPLYLLIPACIGALVGGIIGAYFGWPLLITVTAGAWAGIWVSAVSTLE